jgi:hypothetical protein
VREIFTDSREVLRQNCEKKREVDDDDDDDDDDGDDNDDDNNNKIIIINSLLIHMLNSTAKGQFKSQQHKYKTTQKMQIQTN